MKAILLAMALLLLALPAYGQAAQVTATWTDNSTNEMGFDVERKTEVCAGVAGTWAAVGKTNANAATYVDTNVIEGTTYCYRVDAYNTKDGTPGGVIQKSGYSNTAEIKVPFSTPAGPSGLQLR